MKRLFGDWILAPLLVLSPTNLYSRQQTCAFVGVITNKPFTNCAFVGVVTNCAFVGVVTNCAFVGVVTNCAFVGVVTNKLVFAPTNLKLRHLRLCWCYHQQTLRQQTCIRANKLAPLLVLSPTNLYSRQQT
jgi:hypothetical protein